MVLGFHVMTLCGTAPWQSFNQGVEIFFCISGFVMYVSNVERPAGFRPARVFLKRRLIRVVPLYWLFLTLYLFEVSPGLRGSAGVPPVKDILESYLFVKIYWPILTVGWTLTFELFFYICFAVMLALRRSVFWLILPFVAMVVIDHHALFSPRLLCFLAGMIIGKFTHEDRRLPRGLAWIICAAFAGVMFSLRGNELWTWYWIPTSLSCLLIAAAVSLERDLKLLHFGLLLPLGNASYSLYLSHLLILHVFAGLGRHSYPLTGLLWGTLATLLCCVAAIYIHRYIENPLANWLNECTGGRRPVLSR
jgi:peptidoglycan/LPS O-acetylase OafA/YrhL